MGNKILKNVAGIAGALIAAKNAINTSADKNAWGTLITSSTGHDAESFIVDGGLPSGKNTDGVTIIGSLDGLASRPFETTGNDIESFDGLDRGNHEQVSLAAINMVNANIGIKRDGITTICTVANIGATQNGVDIFASAPFITHGVSSVNGIMSGGQKVPLISNLGNDEIFGDGQTPYKPVYRSTGEYKTDALLLPFAHTSINYNGETVATAPIKVGTSGTLRRLCSNTTYLTTNGDTPLSGVTLSDEASIAKVYVAVNDGTEENWLAINTAGMKGSRFTTVNAGKAKDISTSLKIDTFIDVSKIPTDFLVYATDTAVAKHVLKNDVGQNLVVGISFTLNVNANTDTMVFSSSVTNVTVTSVTDAGVPVAAANSVFTGIVALFAAGGVNGFDGEFFLSNTNNLNAGLVIDLEDEQYQIPANYGAPVIFKKSVVGKVSETDLAKYLFASKVTNSNALSSKVYRHIDKFIEANRSKVSADGFLEGITVDGIGHNYNRPMIISKSVDISKKASRRSGETKEDISKYMLDKIVAHAVSLFTKSGLNKAAAALFPNESITLSIVAGQGIVEFLAYALKDWDNNELHGFKIEVEVSNRLADRCLATIKVGKDVNELSPIILVEGDDYIYAGVETIGQSTSNVTRIYPRNKVLINNPVLLDINFTGMELAYEA